MATIAQNLQKLINDRDDIAAAITTKGGTVNQGDGYDDFAADILTIPSGAPTGSIAFYEEVMEIDAWSTVHFTLNNAVVYYDENAKSLCYYFLINISNNTYHRADLAPNTIYHNIYITGLTLPTTAQQILTNCSYIKRKNTVLSDNLTYDFENNYFTVSSGTTSIIEYKTNVDFVFKGCLFLVTN